MRRVLPAVVAIGCLHRAPPPPAPPPEAPPCVPKLQQGIVQLRDLAERVPEGVSDNDAFDAMAEFLVTAGLKIDTADRAAHTIVTEPFAGETIEWSCDMFEYRQYTYRVSVVGNHWVVGLNCRRSYGWEAHMSGDKVVPADHGVLTECLETAKYTSQLDAMRSKSLVAGARKLLQQRRAP